MPCSPDTTLPAQSVCCCWHIHTQTQSVSEESKSETHVEERNRIVRESRIERENHARISSSSSTTTAATKPTTDRAAESEEKKKEEEDDAEECQSVRLSSEMAAAGKSLGYNQRHRLLPLPLSLRVQHGHVLY